MERISASSPVKRWVLAILPMLALKKGCAWVRVAPVPAAPLLTGSGRYDLPALQGRDEERAYRSEQGTGSKGRGPGGHSFTGWLCTSGEGQRKRLGEGCLGSAPASNEPGEF